MELRDYGRVIASRWAWLVLGAVVGLLLVGSLAALTPTSYSSSVSLYVGASVVAGDDDPAYATLVQDQVLPSVAALATSTGVLQRVAGELHLPGSPAQLAGAVSTQTQLDDAVLVVTASDHRPARAATLAAAVAAEVRARAQLLFPATSGSLLHISLLGTPSTPAPTSTSLSRSDVLLAGFAGAVVAAVLAGLTELRRPRVRGTRDVRGVLDAHGVPDVPVLLVPARGRAGRSRRRRAVPRREDQLDHLRGVLAARAGERSGCPAGALAVVPAGPTDTTARLAGELGDGDGAPKVVADIRTLAEPMGVLVVADGRTTTRRELHEAVAAVAASGRPLVAVVVDALHARGLGAWAAVRGHGRWSLENRTGNSRPHVITGSRVVAVAALAALGFMWPLPLSLYAGLLATVVLLPVWAPAVRRHRGAGGMLAVAGLAVLCGLLLVWRNAGTHGLDGHTTRWMTFLVLTGVCGVGLVLWARTVLPLPAVGLAYGVGALATGVLLTPGAPNPWKFTLSFPVIVIVLSVAEIWGRRAVTVAALLGLGLVSIASDYRSAFAFCVLAAALVLWQSRPRAARRIRWGLLLPGAALVGVGGYRLMTQLLLSGLLGAQVQARTATQVAQSGSLLLGGRPEWTATWALMRDDILGFGLGVLPSAHDVAVARAGLAVTHIPLVDDYLEHQLLDDTGVHLHSIVADMWATMGPVGILLGLVMAALLVHALAERVLHREASGLACVLVPLALWFLAFGPLQDNLPTVTIALGLVLLPRRPWPERSPAPPVEAPAVALPEPAGAR